MNYYDMLDLCYREGIVLSIEDFKPPLNGIYISCDGLHAIMLASRILDNIPLRNVRSGRRDWPSLYIGRE